MDSSQLLCLLALCGYLPKVLSVQMCDVVNQIELEKVRCENSTSGNITSGCQGMWDSVACWPSARVGEVVTITCPPYFSYFSDQHKGNVSKTCTEDGWTEMHPIDIALTCGYNLNSTSDDGKFFWQVKVGYTIGHSVSLISLTTAIVILCIFRKLHCTRNYIHMHLFVSFILKAIAVFIKDVVLYEVGEVDNCSSGSSSGIVFQVSPAFMLLRQRFLCWLGHIRRMEDGRIPKDVLCGELAFGKRCTECPQLRYKDVCKRDLKAVDIDTDSWEDLASDRSQWRSAVKQCTTYAEEKHFIAANSKQARRKDQHNPCETKVTFICESGSVCLSRIGL